MKDRAAVNARSTLAHAAWLACALLAICAARAVAQDTSGDESAAAPASEPASPPADLSVPPDATPTALLALAEEAMTTLDYQRARALAQRAIDSGGLGGDEVARAYALVGVASAQMDDNDTAKRAFLRLFALQPGSDVATRLAPTHRSAVLDARGFWSVHQEGFGIDVSYARRERQVVVKLRDPIGWARTVWVWSRFGDRPYVKAEQAAASELVFDIDDIQEADALEAYVFVTDERGNVLARLGKERDPYLFGLSDEELAAVLRRDIRGGQTGSFARRLEELGVDVGVHGYLSLDFRPEGEKEVPSFDVHHATAMIRADFESAASLEIALEWEHLAIEEDDFYLPHAFLDVKAAEALIVRAGFFEVPVGAFNEYLYPDFLRITAEQPLFASQGVIPSLWSEVGLQLRGRFGVGRASYLTYAAFVSNGLEQHDGMPRDGIVEEGGDLRDMRFNVRDEFHGDKAFGGRAGLELGDFDFGVSGYTGRYTIDAYRQMSIADTDFSYRSKWLTVRTEGAITFEQITDSVLHKYGMYTLVALRPIPYLEPYAQYDFIKVGTRTQRGLLGCAFYPFPNTRATRLLRLKSEAGYEFPQGGDANFVWFFELTTGF
jgi:tetratricopeptide (TPR) repeat protein